MSADSGVTVKSAMRECVDASMVFRMGAANEPRPQGEQKDKGRAQEEIDRGVRCRGDVRHTAAYRLAITASNALPIAATGGVNPVNSSNASAA